MPAVSQMAPDYSAVGGRSEKLLGPFDVLNDHMEEVKVRTLVHLPYRFVPLALDQQLTPRAVRTVLRGGISSEGEGASRLNVHRYFPSYARRRWTVRPSLSRRLTSRSSRRIRH